MSPAHSRTRVPGVAGSSDPLETGHVRQRSGAVLIYALVLISLQLFLLVVAVEGFLGNEDSLAWGAAALSAILFAVSLGFGHLLRHD